MTLPRNDEQVGPAPVNIAGLRAPIGGVLMAAAGSFALLGFPLDDVWHRLFGQDVTLWGPTHLMLIGGAGMCLIGQAVLLAEGMYSRRRPDCGSAGQGQGALLGLGERFAVVVMRRVALMGGLLIGLSTFQAEFDFGVPQFAHGLPPDPDRVRRRLRPGCRPAVGRPGRRARRRAVLPRGPRRWSACWSAPCWASPRPRCRST